MKGKKKTAAILLLVISFVLVLGLSVAYFSDMVTGEGKARMGTLDLRGSLDSTGTALTIKHYDGSSVLVPEPWHLKNVNPGDYLDLEVGVCNEGNKSAWFTTEVDIIVYSNRNSEKVYIPELLSNVLVTDKNGNEVDLYTLFLAEKVSYVTEGYNSTTRSEKITATLLAPVVINGIGDYAEIETAANGKNCVEGTYKIKMANDMGNEYQDRGIQFNVAFKAFQYRNHTSQPTADEWATVEKFDLITTPVPEGPDFSTP